MNSILKLDNFDDIFETLQKRLYPIKISSTNLITIVQCCLEVVELSNKKGPEKKNLVICLIEKLLEVTELDNDDYSFCKDLIKNGTLSDTIDLVISASRGSLNLNNTIETTSGCCYSFYKIYILKKFHKRSRVKKSE